MDAKLYSQATYHPQATTFNPFQIRPIAPNTGISAAISIAQNALNEVQRILMQSQNAITPGHTMFQRHPNQAQFLNNPSTMPVQLRAAPHQAMAQNHSNHSQPVLHAGVHRNNRSILRKNKNLNPCHACRAKRRKCKRITSLLNICERCAELGLSECLLPTPPRPSINAQSVTLHMISTPTIKNLDDKREELDNKMFDFGLEAQHDDYQAS